MLDKDPIKRITITEILEHPMVTKGKGPTRLTHSELGTPASANSPLKNGNTFHDKLQCQTFKDLFSKVTSKNVVEISLKQKNHHV